jgi:hypothetical protein
MSKIISYRCLIVFFQLLFIFYISSFVSTLDLASYYKSFATAFIVYIFVTAYLDYLFQKLISSRKIKLGHIKSILLLTTIISFFFLCIGITNSSLICLAFSFLSLLFTAHSFRQYLNVLSFKTLILRNQMIDAILKLCIMFLISSIQITSNAENIFYSQIFATFISLMILYYFTLISRNFKYIPFQNLLILLNFSEFSAITFSAVTNSIYTNFLKLYLGWFGFVQELAYVGLAQQVCGNLAQSINSILQIQYGNEILRNMRYFRRSIFPTFIFFSIGLVLVVIAKYSLFIIFDTKLNDINMSMYILVLIFEYYIVFISFLTKLYILKNNVHKILYLHIIMGLAVILTGGILYLTNSLLTALYITNGITILYALIYVRSRKDG